MVNRLKIFLSFGVDGWPMYHDIFRLILTYFCAYGQQVVRLIYAVSLEISLVSGLFPDVSTLTS